MFEQNIYQMVDQSNNKEIKEVLDTANNKIIWERAIATSTTPIIPTRDAYAFNLSVDSAACNVVDPSIPEGYVELESAIFDGNSYFDTGIVVTSFDYEIESDTIFPNNSSSPMAVWGFMNSANSNMPRWMTGVYSSKWLTSINNTLPVGTYDSNRHKIKNTLYLDNNTPNWTTFIDGVEIAASTTVISSPSLVESNTLSIYIGARNNNGTAGNFFNGTFYELKFVKNNVLIRDYVALKRLSDNVVVLYDKVNNNMLQNLGSGAVTARTYASQTPTHPFDIYCNNGKLVACHIISGLPTSLVPLDYVSNNNSSTWIDTGIKDDVDDMEYEVRVKPSSGSWYILQSRENANASIYGISGSNSGNKINFGAGGIGFSTPLTSSITRDTSHTYTVKGSHKNGVGTLYVKDETTGDEETLTATYNTNNYVVAPTNIGVWGNGSNFVSNGNYIYYARVKKQGVVVFDYVPSKNTSNVAGFGDLVSNQFKGATSGTINAGNTTIDPIGIVVDGTQETIIVRSKNLNVGTLDNIGFSSTGYGSTSNTFCGTQYIISCEPGDKYTVSCGGFDTSGVTGVFVSTWKTDGIFNMRQAIAITNSLTFTIPADVNKVNFTLYKTGGITIDDDAWMQVELGASATSYEPAIEPIVLEMPDLLGAGVFCDDCDTITGTRTHRIGVKVFDGTETISTTTTENVWIYGIADKIKQKKDLICSHYIYSSESGANAPDLSVISYSSVNVGFKDSTCADAAAFKALLKAQYDNGTPVVVLYPLSAEDTDQTPTQDVYLNKKITYSVLLKDSYGFSDQQTAILTYLGKEYDGGAIGETEEEYDF